MKKTTAKGSLFLFLTACIWGMAFVSQSKGMEFMHPLTFNGVRCLIGALVLLLYLAATGRLFGKKAREIDWKKNVEAGLVCGLVFTAAATLQQVGLFYTTVGKAGFITALYIIFVPLLGIFLRRRVEKRIWGAVAMAAVGMYLLCVTEKLLLGFGDMLLLFCAVLFAVHIMVIDHYASCADGPVISCIQFLVCGLICLPCSLIWGNFSWVQLREGAGALLYAGVLSCGVAYTLQIVGQKDLNPAVASLIMSLESVVAAVAGYIAYRIGLLSTDQAMTSRQIAGCGLVFAAVILVQLPTRIFRRRDAYLKHKGDIL